MNKLLFTLLLSPLLATNVYAELSNCNGVWTNEPCDGKASSKLEEKDFTPQDPQKRLQSKKQQILHDLRMKELNAERAYKVDVAIDAAETSCNNPATTLEDCQEKVSELRDKIDQGILAAKELSIKEKKLEAEKAEAKAKAENNTTTIIIRERRHHHRYDEEYQQIPGTYHREQRSERSGFSIGGSIDGSDAAVSGRIEQRSSESSSTTQIEGH